VVSRSSIYRLSRRRPCHRRNGNCPSRPESVGVRPVEGIRSGRSFNNSSGPLRAKFRLRCLQSGEDRCRQFVELWSDISNEVRDWVELGLPGPHVDEVGIGIVVGVMMGLSDIVRRQAWIRVIFGRNEVRDFPMEEGPNRIGSAEGIEVRLPRDPKLSDVHAALHQTPSGWYLADNNSATGTFLNRSPVQQSYIQNGDEIKAGPYTMLFFIASSPRGFVITRPFLAAIDPPKEVETKQQPELRPRLVDAFGKVSNLAAGASTIGRGEASTISVSYDRTVSRSHAQINLGAGRAVIQDLHSTHGTLVNGEPISVAVTLADGDKIKVGNTLFEYHQ